MYLDPRRRVQPRLLFVDESINFAPANDDLRARIDALSAKIDKLTGSVPPPNQPAASSAP